MRTAPPPAPGSPRPSTARLALLLSVAGLFCCGFSSIVGMILARNDLDAMNQGRTDPANRSQAEIAFAVGILGTVLAVAMFGFWCLVRFGPGGA